MGILMGTKKEMLKERLRPTKKQTLKRCLKGYWTGWES